MKKDLRWWWLCFVHNCVVHPLLPAAEALESLGAKRVPRAVYALHDRTVPEGDD